MRAEGLIFMLNRFAFCAAALQLVAACTDTAERGGASVENAELAVQESALTAQLDSLIADAADRNSRFDIGQGFEAAAEQLKTQLNHELPCAAVTRQGSELRIVYDAAGTGCSWRGRALAGQHTVRVMRNADTEVGVHHELTDYREGKLSLTGSADVTWSRISKSRRVLHTVTFAVLSGESAGVTGQSTGDSTQLTFEGGVRINGLRDWQSSRGFYSLEMQAIEQRFADSVPQLGAYQLTLPTDDALTLAFGRIDTDNIGVTVQGAQRELSFVVHPDGSVEPSSQP
jgi:hypothetical protein